ncbi:MAG: copper homeostasis protein CutC [Candidatus Delongbacteria bacterium]|jgi:copper homeostasis protein|nr:copper homeostasis protein CutC [Candidatus Delongbacteria bacterium]
MKKFKLEICLDSVESAIESEKGGADRVELCDNLIEGGTTPSYGSIKVSREKISIGLQVIIRPRGGDFCYSDIEFEVMKQDIIQYRELGVDGVVIGILKTDGTIDIERTKELIELARPMNVTFHRAFDMTVDPFVALEDIIKIGADRILTSGQQKSAIDGSSLIAELIQKAGNRIIIMPGAGLRENNVTEFIRETNASEIHLAVHRKIDSRMTFRPDHIHMGGEMSEFESKITDAEAIKRIKSLEI